MKNKIVNESGLVFNSLLVCFLIYNIINVWHYILAPTGQVGALRCATPRTVGARSHSERCLASPDIDQARLS